jgi:hypothetical protein
MIPIGSLTDANFERLQLAANDDINAPVPQTSVYRFVGQNPHVSMEWDNCLRTGNIEMYVDPRLKFRTRTRRHLTRAIRARQSNITTSAIHAPNWHSHIFGFKCKTSDVSSNFGLIKDAFDDGRRPPQKMQLKVLSSRTEIHPI